MIITVARGSIILCEDNGKKPCVDKRGAMNALRDTASPTKKKRQTCKGFVVLLTLQVPGLSTHKHRSGNSELLFLRVRSLRG